MLGAARPHAHAVRERLKDDHKDQVEHSLQGCCVQNVDDPAEDSVHGPMLRLLLVLFVAAPFRVLLLLQYVQATDDKLPARIAPSLACGLALRQQWAVRAGRGGLAKLGAPLPRPPSRPL